MDIIFWKFEIALFQYLKLLNNPMSFSLRTYKIMTLPKYFHMNKTKFTKKYLNIPIFCDVSKQNHLNV